MTKLFSNHNTFVLQWHLTVRCQMRCKHCYLYDEVLYANEFKNELHFNECLKIMDDFVHMCNTLKVHPEIHFTGGDPLLREDIFDLIYEAKKRGIRVGILGNSFLLNEDTVKRLKELRKEFKLTQDKLAKLLETTQSVVCGFEKGRNLIATPFLYTICHKYHVSADYLLGRID